MMQTIRKLTSGRPLRWLTIVLFAAGLVSVCSLAEACPMCKQALENSDEASGDIVTGYFWSILFMMSMPFLLLGSFSGYMYLAVRKARREQEAQRLANNAASASHATADERELVEV